MIKPSEMPPRLMGAEIPGEPGSWAAFNKLIPPDYAAFEFLSKQEHESALKRAVAEAYREAAQITNRVSGFAELRRILLTKAAQATESVGGEG